MANGFGVANLPSFREEPDVDAIMRALGQAPGTGGFYESPQTAFEKSQAIATSQREQQLNFIIKLMEAQAGQQIRAKQETDPEARIVQLLKENQIGPTTGTVQGQPMTLQPSGDVIGQLTALMALEAKKKATTAPHDRLGAILGEMSNREKVVRDLTAKFLAAQTGKDKTAMNEIQKQMIAERAALLRDIETMQGLGPEWGAIAQGFGSRMGTAFNIVGIPFAIQPESSKAPATGAAATAPTKAAPTTEPKGEAAPEGQAPIFGEDLILWIMNALDFLKNRMPGETPEQTKERRTPRR